MATSLRTTFSGLFQHSNFYDGASSRVAEVLVGRDVTRPRESAARLAQRPDRP
jgi:hypothetical protein